MMIGREENGHSRAGASCYCSVDPIVAVMRGVGFSVQTGHALLVERLGELDDQDGFSWHTRRVTACLFCPMKTAGRHCVVQTAALLEEAQALGTQPPCPQLQPNRVGAKPLEGTLRPNALRSNQTYQWIADQALYVDARRSQPHRKLTSSESRLGVFESRTVLGRQRDRCGHAPSFVWSHRREPVHFRNIRNAVLRGSILRGSWSALAGSIFMAEAGRK